MLLASLPINLMGVLSINGIKRRGSHVSLYNIFAMRALPSVSLIHIAAGVMSTLIKTTAAFNLPPRYGHRTSAAALQLRRSGGALTVQKFATGFIQPNRYHCACKGQDTCTITKLFSTSADVNLSTPTELTKENSPNALHTVVVHRNKQSLAFREGTPLVFTKSIAATYSEVLDDSVGDFDDIPFGALVAVVVSKDKQSDKAKRDTKNSVKSHSHYTFKDNDEFKDTVNQQLIGYGIYNPHSMYRVRMLLHETIHPGLTKEIRSLRKEMQRGAEFSENDALASILEKKVTDAIQLRMAMNLPSSDTDTYRLINGEGDGLSGLAVDVMGGNTAIVMSSAAWCEIHKDTILSILSKSLALHPSYEDENVDIVWRNTPSRLAQDGYELVEEVERGSEEDPSVVATESSIKYLTFPYSDGQKTGFYCDQRENRKMIAKYCENKRVLDLCCYSGGFSLNAVIHGNASSALGVDSSQDAVDSSTANAKLNGLDDSIISFVRDDIAAFMKSAIDRDEQYDVIILDPPKLAPSISTLTKASRKYHSLNRDAMNLIDKNRGGLLLTCTCSAAMTQSNGGQFFLGVVNNAALSAKRQATLLSVNGAAPCHTQSPASFPAGNYLTCALFFIGPA